MGSLNLTNSTLYTTSTSPYARRVRMAFIECGIQFEEKLIDVWNPTQELINLNPQGRVPVLVTSTGDVLAESNLILQLLFEQCDSGLIPKNTSDRIKVYHWMGISVGLYDRVVSYFLDSLNPKDKTSTAVLERLTMFFSRVLTILEKRFQHEKWIATNALSQADLDFVTALDYFKLRVPASDWEVKFPRVKSYYDRLQSRLSIKSTLPKE